MKTQTTIRRDVADSMLDSYAERVEALEQEARILVSQLANESDNFRKHGLAAVHGGDKDGARYLLDVAQAFAAFAARVKTAGQGR